MRRFFRPRIGDPESGRSWSAGSLACTLRLAGLLCFLLATAAFAQYYPYGPYTTRPKTNNKPRPNTQRYTGGTGKGTSKADVQLQSEVQALRDRHKALLAKLPYSMRSLDKDALQTLDRLPLIAQYGYLATIEDYPTLAVPEQRRLHDTMFSLATLREPERTGYVAAATRTFGNLQNNQSQMKAARSRPHDTCFQIQDTVNQFHAAPAAPAPVTRATSSSTSASPGATGTAASAAKTSSVASTTASAISTIPKPKKKPATNPATTRSSSGSSSGTSGSSGATSPGSGSNQ